MTNLNTLMERLRIQSIVQRLKRTLGPDAALEVVMQAVELEFRDTINKIDDKTQRTRFIAASRSQQNN